MRPQDHGLTQQLILSIRDYDQNINPLPGLVSSAHLNCLVAQMVDSIRRIRYIQILKEKPLSNIYNDPSSQFFDPLKAASWNIKNGSLDEAFWLVFIATHFGKNKKSGWSLPKTIYEGSGSGGIWTWERITSNFHLFRNWLNDNLQVIKFSGSFGNHRKYQSLDAFSPTGTGMAIGSYIDWVGGDKKHQNLIKNAIEHVGIDSKRLFGFLYKSMEDVISFGRTAKFDYLTMIGKLGLAPICPEFTYMEGATGPKRGAKLLFGGSVSANLSDSQLNEMLSTFEQHLGLYFGMQVLEDSLCNWQKNPIHYEYFRG